jgi:hypothetical protein
MKNVYGNPAHADILKTLKTELYRLKKKLKDNDRFSDKLPKDDVG